MQVFRVLLRILECKVFEGYRTKILMMLYGVVVSSQYLSSNAMLPEEFQAVVMANWNLLEGMKQGLLGAGVITIHAAVRRSEKGEDPQGMGLRRPRLRLRDAQVPS